MGVDEGVCKYLCVSVGVEKPSLGSAILLVYTIYYIYCILGNVV